VLGPEEEDGLFNNFNYWYNYAKMIKARELDWRNVQTNGVEGRTNGISFGKHLETPRKRPKVECKVLLK